MVVVLLEFCPNMVVAMLTFKIKNKKSKHGGCPASIFKSPDMVVVLLEFLSNMAHVLFAYSNSIKMSQEA